MVTLTALLSTEPSVRVRCTSRTAASGDAAAIACVSSMFCVFLTPETIWRTIRSITKCSAQRMTRANRMMKITLTSVPKNVFGSLVRNAPIPVKKPLTALQNSSIGCKSIEAPSPDAGCSLLHQFAPGARPFS